MIRPAWRDVLDFAAQTDLVDLVDPARSVSCVLEDEPGWIAPAAVAALEKPGLPTVPGILYPAAEPFSVLRNFRRVFLLGSYDIGRIAKTSKSAPDEHRPNVIIHEVTFMPDPTGPKHLFVADTATGEVLKVSREVDGYEVKVNSTVDRFVEMMWRFSYLSLVLFEMQHSGTDEVPFASYEEAIAIKERIWAVAQEVDPAQRTIQTDGFWWGNIWEYL